MANGSKLNVVPVISVINMKGGVGKTTICAHLFRHMMDYLNKSILLVDFDPQFNLTQALVTQSDYKKHQDDNKTIFSVMESPTAPTLLSVTKNIGPPPPVDDIVRQLFYWTKTKKTALGLIPGDFKMTKYTLVDDPKSLQPVQKRFNDFIDNAKKDYDLIVIDCNPSSSFMSLCALSVSTHLLIPVRSDRYSILGLELLDEFVSKLPSIVNKPKKMVLINGKNDVGFESTLRANAKFGPLTLSTALKETSLLGAHEGRIGCATDKKLPYVNTLKNNLNSIIDEMKIHLGW